MTHIFIIHGSYGHPEEMNVLHLTGVSVQNIYLENVY